MPDISINWRNQAVLENRTKHIQKCHRENLQKEWLQHIIQSMWIGGVTIPGRRRKYRRRCNSNRTAYLAAAACPSGAHITSHDNVVYCILKTLLISSEAPEEFVKSLHFEKVTFNRDFSSGIEEILFRAGTKILTEKGLYHNKPDITIKLSDPNRIILIEVAIVRIQNNR